MLGNVKKNNIGIFEAHVHVSSFQIYVHVRLQINLKCTDAENMTVHACMHFRNTKLLKEKTGYIN